MHRGRLVGREADRYRPVSGVHHGLEGVRVGILSNEPIVLIGPGSEWFWSMAQFVIVALLSAIHMLRSAGSGT